jgi:integrase/recombinase XerD
MTDRTSLGHWIRRFLLEYAASERNLSANTSASYRDMLVLLLPFVAKRKGVAADALSVTDLSVELVRSFLVYLEQERQCCTATRNQRLASIHALARFIGEHSPQHVEWCAQVRMVPMKKGTTTSLTYLEKSEMDALLAAPDQSSTQGRRDHALLLFLYNSTTPVLASAKQLPSGSATSTGTPSPFGSRVKGTSSVAARSGPQLSSTFVTSRGSVRPRRICS